MVEQYSEGAQFVESGPLSVAEWTLVKALREIIAGGWGELNASVREGRLRISRTTTKVYEEEVPVRRNKR